MALTYQEHPVSGRLAVAVRSFWSYSFADAARPTPVPYRVLPDGCIDLIARYTHPPRADRPGRCELAVTGLTARLVQVELAPHTTLWGVQFRPGWAEAGAGAVPAPVGRRLAPGRPAVGPAGRAGPAAERAADGGRRRGRAARRAGRVGRPPGVGRPVRGSGSRPAPVGGSRRPGAAGRSGRRGRGERPHPAPPAHPGRRATAQDVRPHPPVPARRPPGSTSAGRWTWPGWQPTPGTPTSRT